MNSTQQKREDVLAFGPETLIKGFRLLDATSSEGPLDTANRLLPLGEGGSAVVYLAEQQLFGTVVIRRAIKFFMYRADIAELTEHAETGPVSYQDFLVEVANIARVSHQNLLQVIDAGVIDHDPLRIPFIVSQFISGPTLRDTLALSNPCAAKVAERLSANPSSFFDLLLQIADAIGYLHDQGYAHCDIAPKNIFLDLSTNVSNVRPILGDLGLAKSFSEQSTPTVLLAGSVRYMPAAALAILNKRVPWTIFSALQPAWDIFAFAKSAHEALTLIPEKPAVAWRTPLDRSFSDAMSGNRYHTIHELKKRIEFLRPASRQYSRVPELIVGMSARRLLMPAAAPALSRRLHPFSEHPALTRLSRVPQLTVAAHRFPGAVHTRYEHSLGVFETTREYLLSLLDQSEFLEHLSQEQIEAALLCGLLWNITRFPFSSVIHECKAQNEPKLACFSQLDLLSDLFSIKNRHGETIPDLVAFHFSHVDLDHLTALLTAKRESLTDQDEFVFSLFNCSLDARVVDFVRRDSLHLGIFQGDAFDLRELLPHLTIVDHKLALRVTGVTVAEQIIALRYWLFNRVYWNRPNRTFVAMLKALFSRLLDCSNIALSLRAICLDSSEDEVFAVLAQHASLAARADLCDLAALLRPQSQRLYKVALDVSSMEDGRLATAIEQIGQFDQSRVAALAAAIVGEINHNLTAYDPQSLVPLLVDIPKETGARKLGEDITVIGGSTGGTRNLRQVSGIVDGINKSFDEHLCRLRVFVHPRIFPGETEARQQIENSIRAFLIKSY